ncbi:MAG: hypothetical protein GEU87_02415 [Alphaproteobacteria bacterium]|nr:hypothetical protein [Alphaproteobacteria bacterium]
MLDSQARPVRSLWAIMDNMSLDDAKCALKEREGCQKINAIHSSDQESAKRDKILDLDAWAEAHSVEHVIWTGLPPKFDNQNSRPDVNQVIRHLHGLRGAKRDNAERYIRRAPRQIDTEYRRAIEAEFGWTYFGNDEGVRS